MSEEQTSVQLSKDAEKILEMVKTLSVSDLANLVKTMEKEFGVSAAAPVAVAMPQAASGAETGGEASPSQVNVELTTGGSQKIAAIKAVRELTGLGLKEAKDLVDGAPKVLKENVPKEQAEEMKKKLEAAGATVTLK